MFAERRGVFTLGPVELSAGDPFARRVAAELRPGTDTFLVWPRTVPTTELEPPDRWGDRERARGGLAEDPARFAGVRPYAPGDPLRRIHARASARTGAPVTKRFEPSRDREVLIALDVQTAEGAAWEAGWADDDVESLYVVAASIARSLALRRVAFGILAAGYTRRRDADRERAGVVRAGAGGTRAGPPGQAVLARVDAVRAAAGGGGPDRPAGDHGPGAHGEGSAPLRGRAAAAGARRAPTSCSSRRAARRRGTPVGRGRRGSPRGARSWTGTGASPSTW